jgi:choline kinase
LDRPLLDYTLEAFVHAGIKEIGLVIGYRGRMLAEYLRRGQHCGASVRCLVNSDYRQGNGSSICAAREFVRDEPFIVAMADHLISPEILERLLASLGESTILCVDRQACVLPQLNDATRVWVDEEGFVLRIGKALECWNGVDAGVFLFQRSIFSILTRLKVDEARLCTVTRAVRQLITNEEGVRACDVSGCFWQDIDTLGDLAHAQRALRHPMASAS